MVADRGLRLAERLNQSARAHLGLSGDEAQETQPARIGQGREPRRQLVGLARAEGGAEHRWAAVLHERLLSRRIRANVLTTFDRW